MLDDYDHPSQKADIYSLSIQLLFWQQMISDMGVNYTQLNTATSVNNAGLSMGCILFIPFARRYGRRPVYVASTALMAAMAFWTARMQTVAELYVTQLITGLAGAVNETIVQMTVMVILGECNGYDANVFRSLISSLSTIVDQ